MLSSSFYILNKCEEVNEFKIYPYLKHFSNNFRNEDQIRGVTIPDVLPGSQVSESNFSMTAGEEDRPTIAVVHVACDYRC